MKAVTLARLLVRRFRGGDEYSGYLLAQWLTRWLHPTYRFSEYGRSWLKDDQFISYYLDDLRMDDGFRSADRKYFLRSICSLVSKVPGEVAECGVYRGSTARLLADHLSAPQSRQLHLFDSFMGLSEPGPRDGVWWSYGDLSASRQGVETLLGSKCGAVVFHTGWIPTQFSEVEANQFCLVHVDVDLYAPTLASIAFFYPRLPPGGVIVFDDYGFESCPGARAAVDEYFADKPERPVHVPTGQAFVIRTSSDVVG